jgi:hypothetical protein
MERHEGPADHRAINTRDSDSYKCDGVSDYVRVGLNHHEDVYFTIHRGEPGPEREHFFVCVEQEISLCENFENDGQCNIICLYKVRPCTTRLKGRYEQD